VTKRRRAVVLGGAGFIGSHIVERLIDRGDDVVVVDGLMAETGGSLRHLDQVKDQIELHLTPIESVAGLDQIVAGAELIVDCMAWTRHVAALTAAEYDAALNLASHLHLLKHLRSSADQKVVYLGSRSQYGRVAGAVITEETPMMPTDVQGVHKAAADHHFRIQATLRGLNVVSLRLPNCFGERQPTAGEDIGLVGDFIRTIHAGKAIQLFGVGRKRSILYVGDVVDLVMRISDAPFRGFVPLNAEGSEIEIGELARLLISIMERGSVEVADTPEHVRQIDVPFVPVSTDRLRSLIGEPPHTAVEPALRTTVAYFEEALR
jgi:UDP-glucose 4-epimerase